MAKGNGWRGCENVFMIPHGEWSDPDLVWEDKYTNIEYTFNYWDIENALWEMFLEDTGHADNESNIPEVEIEFDKYIQEEDRAEWYLRDVIAGGYFNDCPNNDWHDLYAERREKYA